MKRFEKVSRRNLSLRRSASLICVIALLATTLSFGPLTAVHSSEEGRQQTTGQPAPTTKRPLTHQDYDTWRSIQASQISRDGKFVAYAFMPQDGDGEIVVRNVASGVEWRAPRGYRPPVPPPDDPSVNIAEVLATQARLVRPVFTADSRYVVFSIEPSKAEVNKAKKEKKKPEEMPKTGLGIMDVSSGLVTRIEKVKNFQVPEDGSGFIAYLLEPEIEKKPVEKKPEEKKPEEKKTAKKPETPQAEPSASSPGEPLPAEPNEPKEPQEPKPGATPSMAPSPAAATMPFPQPGETPIQPQSSQASGIPAAADKKKKEYGSELVLRNLTNMSERRFSEVLDFTLSKDAKTLVFAVSSKKEEGNGVYAVPLEGVDRYRLCSAARVSIKNLPGTKTRRNWLSSATKRTPARSSQSPGCITGIVAALKPQRLFPLQRLASEKILSLVTRRI